MHNSSDFSAALKILRRQAPVQRSRWRRRFLLLPRRMRSMLDGLIPAEPTPVIWEVTLLREVHEGKPLLVPSLRQWTPSPEDLVARDWLGADPWWQQEKG